VRRIVQARHQAHEHHLRVAEEGYPKLSNGALIADGKELLITDENGARRKVKASYGIMDILQLRHVSAPKPHYQSMEFTSITDEVGHTQVRGKGVGRDNYAEHDVVREGYHHDVRPLLSFHRPGVPQARDQLRLPYDDPEAGIDRKFDKVLDRDVGRVCHRGVNRGHEQAGDGAHVYLGCMVTAMLLMSLVFASTLSHTSGIASLIKTMFSTEFMLRYGSKDQVF
jgi:hypothetical protein